MNVHIKCKTTWYAQTDGLAMGASLAVILASLWINESEKSLQKPNEGMENKIPDIRKVCIGNTLLREEKELSASHVKTGSMQNFQVSITNIEYNKLQVIDGSGPIVQKNV